MKPEILVVEDNESNLLLLRAVLRPEFEVVAASDADEARHYLRSAKPDLILMDVGLPGTNGLELTQELKSQPSFEIPIVILTAHALAAHEAAAKAVAADGFITKPINTRALPGTLKRVLAQTIPHDDAD